MTLAAPAARRDTDAPGLFLKWAHAVPDRVALIHPGGRVCYAELAERAARLAARLTRSGVRRGDAVGVVMERSPLLPVTVLAIWLAGGAHVPVPASCPAARNRLVLAEAGVRTLVADREPDRALLPRRDGSLRCVRVDRPEQPPVRDEAPYPPNPVTPTSPLARRPHRNTMPRRRPETATGPEDLAYVLYTSGTSGTPKGVLVPHRAVVALAHGLRRLYGDLEGARVLQFAPLTFDVWIWEFAMSVLSGGTLVVPGAGGPPHGGPELSRTLRRWDITHFSAAPSLLATLPERETIPVTTLTSGGEPLPDHLVRRWGARTRLFNAYGPTEAGVCATAGRIRPGHGPVTIGKPLAEATVHLLDEWGTPVPDGETGEIHIGGPGVGLGYLNRPEDTRAHFLPDRFAPHAGHLLYRTGDLARRLPGGDLVFLGRIDEQLNVRGYRIEPGEVEAALLRHPDVTGAVVTATDRIPGARPHANPPGTGTDRLTAYLQVAPGRPVAPADLRRQLAPLLPAHLIPSSFVILDRLPLNAHGKVDRAALTAPTAAAPTEPAVPPDRYEGHSARGSRRPHSVERTVARLVGDVLGVADIGPDEDFTDLGATSLDLVRLQAVVADRWGITLAAADLLGARTVRRLIALLERGAAGTEPDPLP
ncbi:non-ribosomal peptide synthetase [Streptomyces silvensis]|uniref:Carrier domain-containing protein n=1 Tax=Streptomyces silvensis TaxID=1765722 RepID=A0A0W7WV76_9ACTN|nr:non-ribosomal peptide synthetase [Streptomyces silvensis]KUF14464.1 hypothetical protein AT728_31870 [Streptomyces silvensis]